ncbi:MAG: cell division protein FtsZ [Chthoniobacterales bacterium]
MIQVSRNYSLSEKNEELIVVKVVGIGGAGSNALDRVVLDGLDKADLIAMNTDAQSLASSVAAHKVQLGRTLTRGLGAGGDPEVGLHAAEESTDEIRQALADARVIFICAGLGGGTGSGAAPVVAEIARETGALVVAFATLPFSFEGKRRTAQAIEALMRLHQFADAIVCFENNRMGDIVAPKAGIHQAFAAADVTISQSVRCIVGLIQRPGLIRIGFDDLLTALQAPSGRCLFGYGESDSDNRAHDALTLALKNPLMDRGRMLSEAANVLVHVAGGPAMTLSEVEVLMQELNRHIDDRTQILFGTSVDGRMGNRLSVTIISSLSAEDDIAAPSQTAVQTRPARRTAASKPAASAPETVAPPPPQEPLWEEPPIARSAEPVAENSGPPEPPELIEFVEPAPTVCAEEVVEPENETEPELEPEPIRPAASTAPSKKKIIWPKEPKPLFEKPTQARQEVLQFEPVTRGRFEKSEPTIVEGQDLDVPTFMRKNVRVK